MREVLPYLKMFKWEVQNDIKDNATSFIYECRTIEDVIHESSERMVDVGYAVHRWYNYKCSKAVEDMFCKYGAEHYPNEKDHDVDIILDGVNFDVKLSVISKQYGGDKDLTTRRNKDAYMHWLHRNASTEQRHHIANKIYVICDTIEQKCDFDRIEEKVKAFIAYFKRNKEQYKRNTENCELIYIGE